MITIEELENYLSQGEGIRIEFKEASFNFPHSAYETLVSFSNKEWEYIKKFLFFIQILLLALSPVSMDMLMGKTKYERRSSFQDLYIKPLLETRFLMRTIPDKPNSPNQKYVISEKGRLFLSGYDI